MPDPGFPFSQKIASQERDSLTGTYSRLHLNEILQKLIESCSASGENFSLLMLDIDHFKSINDAFGHRRGDEVLDEFARRMQQVLRNEDLAFRYGGDEFVILLPVTGKTRAGSLARRLLEAVQAAEFQGSPTLSLSLSIGVATYPQDGADPESLFTVADRYHYEAKRTGRNRVVTELAAPATSPLESPALIERDAELARLSDYLAKLLQGGHWICTISGPAGSGKSRLLAEATRLSHSGRFMVLNMQGSLANQKRNLGALKEALRASDELVPAPMSLDYLVKSLNTWLETKDQTGLMILLDDPHLVDPETLAILPRLRTALHTWPVGLIHTSPMGFQIPQTLSNPLVTPMIELRPLSATGVRQWIQASLHWEAPSELVDWLHAQTGGWPGNLHRSLQRLVEHDVLYEIGGQWRCLADYASTPLEEWLTSPQTARCHLPVNIGEITGRDEELSAVKQLIHSRRMVTLHGPGGIGKTRLAIQIGLERLPEHADGVALVSCDALRDQAETLHHIADAIGLQFSGNQEIGEQLLHYLSQKDLLLILDNLDSQSGSLSLISQILESAPQVKLLVTARERLRLGLPGEALYELSSLPCTGPGENPAENSAVHLFVHSAQQVEPRFSAAPDDYPTIVRICQLLEGMPLALELAASWVGTHTLSEIADEIEKGLGFLSSERADLPERHRSLVAVFDSFWSMLSPDEQAILCKLAVFDGGFTGLAAQRVAGASPFFLDALVRRAFLRKASAQYYVMHELLRRYAVEKLSADKTNEQYAHTRHCQYYMDLLESHRDEIAKGTIASDWVTYERHNLRKAWDWAIRQLMSGELRRGMYGLYSYYQLSGNFKVGELTFGDAIGQIEAAFQATSDQSLHPVLAYLLIRRAGFLNKLGLFDEALEDACRGVEMATVQGNRAMQAEGLLEWGDALRHKGDFRVAAEILERGISIAVVEQMPILQVDFLYALGAVAHYLGDIPKQRHYADQALAISTRSSDLRGEGRAYNLLAIVSEMDGDYAQARLYYQRSIQICRAAGDRRGESIPLVNLGAILQLLGSYGAARSVYEQFLEIKRATSDRQGEIWGLNYLSLLAHQSGNQPAALAYARQALEIAVELGDHNNEGNALTNLGHALAAIGDADAAVEAYQRALALRRERGQTRLAMETLAGLARVRLSQSQPVEAVRLVDEILTYLEGNTLDGDDDPFRVWLTCYQVLSANQDQRGLAILARAYNGLQERASRIGDPELQLSFLENVITHQELVAAWQKHRPDLVT